MSTLTNLGAARLKLGRTAEAAALLEEALALEPGNGYWHDFDAHLVQVLRYRAPERLVQGLAGQRDNVVHGDIGEYLRATSRRYDLVVAADVFIYVGALEQVFDGVARVMPTGGRFCFSVELADAGHDLVLRPSLR